MVKLCYQHFNFKHRSLFRAKVLKMIENLFSFFSVFNIFLLVSINKMEPSQEPTKGKKKSPMILSVLKSPPRSELRQVLSPSSDYSLLQNGDKKLKLQRYRLTIPKSKLLSNLQTYEWRHNTDFPIVKTLFVDVRQNQSSFSQLSEIRVYTEHYPARLTQIYEISLGQALYVLKEAMIGFQRLFNRVGPFEIFNSMIAVNERGFCRVWLNENFGVNSFVKKGCSQGKMISKIITIIESHSQQSRASRKIFNELRDCNSFLKSLKSIDKIVKEFKIFLPKKFINPVPGNNKQSPKIQTKVLSTKRIQFQPTPSASIRLSIKDEKIERFRPSIHEYLKVNPKSRKNSTSPLQIRRFNTDYAIKDSSGMKTSDQTAHTGSRNRTSNIEPMILSSKELRQIQKSRRVTPSKNPKWVEQQEFAMDGELNPNKDLFHSVTFRSEESRNEERKYSCKISPNKNESSPTKYQYFSKKSVDEPYFSQFEQLLNQDTEVERPSARNTHETQQQMELSFMVDLKGKVIKNNGWIENVRTLTSVPKKLEESFQQSHEGAQTPRSIKLEKLDKMGRTETQRSIHYNEHLNNVFI